MSFSVQTVGTTGRIMTPTLPLPRAQCLFIVAGRGEGGVARGDGEDEANTSVRVAAGEARQRGGRCWGSERGRGRSRGRRWQQRQQPQECFEEEECSKQVRVPSVDRTTRKRSDLPSIFRCSSVNFHTGGYRDIGKCTGLPTQDRVGLFCFDSAKYGCSKHHQRQQL